MKRYIRANIEGLIKVTGGSSKDSIYDTKTDGIDISFAINRVPFKLRFYANHGRYVVDGIDTNTIIFDDKDRLDLTVRGGSSRSYAVSVPSSIMTSAPKENQKDFGFTGQYYSIAPVIKYVKQLLKDLLTEHPEYFNLEVLDRFGIR